MRQTFRYWLYKLFARAQVAATEYRGDAVWITGKEKHSGEPLSTFYYGTSLSYDYLIDLFYSEHSIAKTQENVSVRHGARLLKTESASDIVIGDLAWPYCLGLASKGFLRVPPQISHRIALPADWSSVEQRFSARKTTRDELRKVEKFGLTFRTTQDAAALDRFYDTMYLPYARRRHAHLVDVEPRDVIQRAGARGALIEVTHGGAVVGGGLLHRVDHVMQFLLLGIVDGLDAALQGAVGAALYCFSMRHAIDVGCTEINLMYTPAHLNNGIHRYKRKLGSRVGNDWPFGQVLMKVVDFKPAVVSLFAHTPFAAVGPRSALHARVTVAQDGLSPDDIRKLGAYYACEGLERVKIFSMRPLSEQVLRTDYSGLDGGLPLELHDLTRSASPAMDFCRS
jgi:Acetyltransferase (GNAT) domain